jgi:hypothetical protein
VFREGLRFSALEIKSKGETLLGKSFRDSLPLQRLEAHSKLISQRGYLLEDHSDEKRKLHDLVCWLSDTWFEAKTDYSAFTERLLVEAKANVPSLDGLPLRTPLPFAEVQPLLASLPSKYDALATDQLNLEPKHCLSYLFNRTGDHYLLDLRALRRQIDARRYDLIAFQDKGGWHTLAYVVPTADCVGLEATLRRRSA